MGRGPKPAKSKEAKPSVARKSPKNEGSRVHDLEKRLAEALGQLQTCNRELVEAREQQIATSEILRVISSSPTALEPVAQTIADSAGQLCNCAYSAVFRFDGELIYWLAARGVSGVQVEALRGIWPRAPDRETLVGRAILARETLHIHDAASDPTHARSLPTARAALAIRSWLGVPILREGEPIGVIALVRLEVRPFTEQEIALVQTFANQALIAIENVRLFTETKEALERQTATSEILRVISASPTDVSPVFRAIVRSATQLCDATFGTVFRFDGGLITVAANQDLSPEEIAVTNAVYPAPATRGIAAGRAIVDRAVVHISDIRSDPDYVARVPMNASGYRTALAVPMLREGTPIGVFVMWRREVRPFSDKQIELVKTFADQAVIAIENVRLFRELQEKNSALTTAHSQVSEALERQTATSEILRVISSSPTNAQPVFEAIVRSAVRLCNARFANVFRLENDVVHLAAHHNVPVEALEHFRRTFPQPLSQGGTLTAQAMRQGTVVHIHDVEAQSDVAAPVRALTRSAGYRTVLAVPILRPGNVVGAIGVGRSDVTGAPWPFSDKEIALLKTFADQAVIAIENVRLFTELQASNRELTTSLDQQTATSEILRVISRSQTDVQPVFDTIVQSAVRLCAGLFGALFQFDGELLHMVAHHNYTPEALEAAHRVYPARPSRDHGSVRAIVERAVVHIPDVELDPEHQHRKLRRAIGQRSGLFVPMLREGDPIGVIMVARPVPGPFSNNEIELLKTFADQAVIAIENVRLFKELEVRNRDLTEALDQQTATSEVLKVISRSTFDLRPVLEILIESATRLCGAQQGFLFTSDGELHHLAVEYNAPPAFKEWVLTHPSRTGDASVVGRVARDGCVIQILDAQADAAWRTRNTGAPGLSGVRSLLGVPMRREGVLIGVIAMWRTAVRPYSDKERQLVETFADQAVIAIENVRLVTELQARTQDLTRSVDQLTALGEVGRAVSSTLDLETVLSTIVSRAVQLSGLDGGVVFEYEEATEEFVQRVATETGGTLAEVRRTTRFRKGEGVLGRTAITLEPVQVPDITVPGAYESRLRENLIESGIRAILAVPMVREDRLIGCLAVTRNHPGEFPSETIELLRTFATQSALAIQNARLFREIEDKSRQLEAASQHKSEFLANMSHELRTPLNAIIGFSEVLSDRMFGELNEKQEEYLKDIYASGTHLLSLINDILDLSKIEAGRMELELTNFHLPTALDNALMLVRERAGRRSLTLDTSIDNRLGEIQADERKIRQVVLNLLSNAIKFTPEGGRIDVAAVPKDGLVEVSVSDTGVGIAPEDQEKVFEEFRQVGTADKKAEGTGLGLTLCRKFIELHGGKIRVKSQVGVGSTFTFTVPVRQSD